MSEQFYTDEELALMNSMSDAQPQPTATNEHPDAPPQVSYSTAPDTSASGRIADGFEKLSASLNDDTHPVKRGIEVARAAYSIILGSLFVIIPLVIFVPSFITVIGADAGIAGYIPILMVSIFVLVGGSVVFKAIKQLIRAIKGK